MQHSTKYVVLLEGGQVCPAGISFQKTLSDIKRYLRGNTKGPGSIVDYGIRTGRVICWSTGCVSFVSDLMKAHKYCAF